MHVDNSDISCGVDCIIDLSLDAFKTELKKGQGIKQSDGWGHYYYEVEPTFAKGYSYIFSDSVVNGNGQAIADFIRKHKLGSLIATRPRKNPNSGNMIKIWIWRFNGKRNWDANQDKRPTNRVGR